VLLSFASGDVSMGLTVSEISKIRSRFPVFDRKTYLNSCSQGALSDAVEAGIREYIESWHELGSPWDLWTEKYEEARRLFAEFIGAAPEEIAVVASASAGINAVASALKFNERRKVVMGEYEFPTMGQIWLAQRARGAEVHFVEGADNRIPAESYYKAIDRQTLIVPLTQVSFVNGNRSDVESIVQAAHSKGALVMLDSYQDCGTRPISVKQLGVDFMVTGTLKYLLGPPGLAFLYVSRELAPALEPSVTGWFAQANPFEFNAKSHDPAPTAKRFEAGTPPIPNIYAASAGIRLLGQTGLDGIAAHVSALAQQLIRSVNDLGIEMKTAADSVGPLVVLKCKNAQSLVEVLSRENIVVSCRKDGLRVSFHLYNTADDVSRLLEALTHNRSYF
jgi:selenocysteine lyase/cysteine desulfurase